MTKRGKEWMVWGLLFLGFGAILAGIYGMVMQSGKATGNLIMSVTADDWVWGDEKAPITFVEYSDFQCPACKYFSSIIKQLKEEKENEVRIVFRHFPLRQHAYARIVALAAEAAGKQEKFWEMHDLLFERQSEWSTSEDIQKILAGYAVTAGLDVDVFFADMQNPALAEKIDRDIDSGIKQGVKGTPTFYLNGEPMQFKSYNELLQLIEEKLNK